MTPEVALTVSGGSGIVTWAITYGILQGTVTALKDRVKSLEDKQTIQDEHNLKISGMDAKIDLILNLLNKR